MVGDRSAIGSRYQTTTGEDTEDWEDLVRVVVDGWASELGLALLLLCSYDLWVAKKIQLPNQSTSIVNLSCDNIKSIYSTSKGMSYIE
jgi:hypothetical protein